MLRHLISLLLLYVCLLFNVTLVNAAPPAKPSLAVNIQGLNIDAEWSAPGATGYRLFYTSQSDPSKTEQVEMGNLTSISGRLEHGTAMSIMVQAYNEDGDSPLSEIKSFVIEDPLLSATPAMLQPDAQPLNFQAVFLDTPVAFVPTTEDTTKQQRALRSATPEYGPEFEEGRIGMTVHIAPALVHRDELELSLCLQVAEECEPLLIYSNDQPTATETPVVTPPPAETKATTTTSAPGRYAKTIVIPDLPTDVEKSVYLEILMPSELAEKLRGRPESKYTVYASDVRSQNPAAKQVAVAEVPVVDLGEETGRSTRGSTSWASCSTSASVGGIYCKTRTFGKNFSNAMFGVGFDMTPGLWLFKVTDAQSESKMGVSIGADANITAKVFGYDINNLGYVRGVLIKNSGQTRKPTRKLTLNMLGANIYTKEEYRTKPATGSATWTPCNGSSNASCSYEPAGIDSAGQGGSGSDEADADDKMLDYSYVKEKSQKKIFVVWIVPVTVEGGIRGTAGVTAGATLRLVTEDYLTNSTVNLNYTPTVSTSYNAVSGDQVCFTNTEVWVWMGPTTTTTTRCVVIPTAGIVQFPKSAVFGVSSANNKLDICGWATAAHNTYSSNGLPYRNQAFFYSTAAAWFQKATRQISLYGPKLKVELLSGTSLIKTVRKDTSSSFTEPGTADASYSYCPDNNLSAVDTIRISRVSSSETFLKFDASGGPYANVKAFASGGVSIFIAEVGVRATLTLLGDSLGLSVKATLAANSKFEGYVQNTLNGPDGNVELYAKYYVPAFSLPPWEEKEATLNLVSWSSFSNTFNLYQWSSGSEQASQPNLPSGGANGEYVPEFTNVEPPEGERKWVCLYKGFNFSGDVKCTKMPSDYKEIGFNLADVLSGWDDAVQSIKVFGPLRLAVFENRDFQGDSFYYYAHYNTEKIGGYSTRNSNGYYYSNFALDRAVSSVRMTTIDTQVAYSPGDFSATFYESSDKGGLSFSESTSGVMVGRASMLANAGEDADWWDNEVSSVYITGIGVVCLYQSSNYGGFQSCYAGEGGRLTVNQGWMDNKTSSYALYAGKAYPLMLIQNSSGSIEEAGTSSLPNGSIMASGPMEYGSSGSLSNGNSADVAVVTGPATIFLYSNTSYKGEVAVFYLDAGEWDATYLINMQDDVESTYVRNTNELMTHSWADMVDMTDLPWTK